MPTDLLSPTSFAGLKVDRPDPTDKITKLNMLIYGEAGAGKTWLAGSASRVPSMRNVLYVDAESGRATLREHPDVEVLTTKRYRDYIDIYNALHAGGHNYGTVVLDSLSEMLEQTTEQVMFEMKDDPDNERRDPDVPSLLEYNKATIRLLRLVRRFRDLPMNVIFIAHAENVQQKSGKRKWMPLLTNKLQMKVPQIPDVVLFMYNQEVDGEQRRLVLTEQTDTAVAKVRGVKLPTVLGAEETVTMQLITDYYTGKRKA